MVRPLKKCTRQGTPYIRPAVIEQSIALALTQDLDQLRTRSAVADRADPAYLESEVLVHLIRNALTARDKKTAHALMECLGRRCIRILKHKVPATHLFNADDVREDTLGALYELFAKDLYAPSVGVLDFFESKFNKCFAALRTSAVRTALAHSSPGKIPLEPLPEADGDAPLDPQEWAALARPEADPEQFAERAELYRMIEALPPEERDVIVWRYIFGYPTEAADPTEITVAAQCKVSEREVRSRVKAAIAHLKRMKEQS